MFPCEGGFGGMISSGDESSPLRGPFVVLGVTERVAPNYQG
jgi:hypothetical protein